MCISVCMYVCMYVLYECVCVCMRVCVCVCAHKTCNCTEGLVNVLITQVCGRNSHYLQAVSSRTIQIPGAKVLSTYRLLCVTKPESCTCLAMIITQPCNDLL